MSTKISALVFCGLLVPVMLFQLALALGVPWGEFAMGGAFPGSFPPEMRVAALVQIPLLALIGAVVLARAGLTLESWHGPSRRIIWLIVAMLAVSTVLNLITQSVSERLIWSPVAFVLFATSLHVALDRRQMPTEA